MPGGTAHVFYPEASAERCTAALLLEVDPIALVRGKGRRADGFSLGAVRQRPPVRRLAPARRRARQGVPDGDERPLRRPPGAGRRADPAGDPRAGAARAAAAPSSPSGCSRRSAGPSTPSRVPLDPTVPEWGDSRYVDLRADRHLRLADALNHLYVLLPVLDDAKHYWVAHDEVDKLVRAGEGWLAEHPERELIIAPLPRAPARPGRRRRSTRLAELDDAEPRTRRSPRSPTSGRRPLRWPLRRDGGGRGARASRRRAGRRPRLRRGRTGRASCSTDPTIDRDRRHRRRRRRAAQVAARRLHFDTHARPAARPARRCAQSSLTYRDERLAGLDAAVLMEVIEHVDPPRLPALDGRVFGAARRGTVVVTTPNTEYNVRYEALPAGDDPPPRPPLRVDPRRVRGLGPAGGEAVRLHRAASCRSAPTTPRSGRRPSWRCSPGRRRPMTTRRPGARPRRAGRRSAARASRRSPRTHFLPTEVISSRLLPRPGRGRRERPGGDQATPSRCCTTSPASGCAAGRLTVVDATNVQPEARGALVALAREHDVLPVAIVLDVPERVCARAQRRTRPTASSAPHVRPAPARPAAPRRCGAWRGRASARSTCSAASRRSRPRPIERERLVQRPARPDRAVRHHRRRPRLPLRARDAAHRARLRRRP